MKAQLENIDGLQIAEMSEINKEAKLDGGDVLFTGKKYLLNCYFNFDQRNFASIISKQ